MWVAAVGVMIVGGCSPTAVHTPHSATAVRVGIKAITIRRVPPSLDFMAAAIAGGQWTLTTGRDIAPQTKDLTLSFEALGYGVAGFRVPMTNPPWFEYTILGQVGGSWRWVGVVDAPWQPPYHRHDRGLRLPFKGYLAAESHPGSSRRVTVWLFEHRHQAIVLVRQPQYATSLPGYQQIKGTSIYIRTGPGATVLSALDQGWWVTVAGRFAPSVLLRVYRSLASPNAGLFPYSS